MKILATMTADSTISLALIFLILTGLGNIVSIWATFHNQNVNRAKEQNTDIEKEHQKELNNEKNFLKINMKLEEFGRCLRDIAKSSDKTSEVLNEIQTHIVKLDGKVDNHEDRISQLEERFKSDER
jgi:peptidoglycan hydrolase CwlO-like protein